VTQEQKAEGRKQKAVSGRAISGLPSADCPLPSSYVILALRIDQHFPGFVDSYFGPAELREQAAAGDRRDPSGLSPSELALNGVKGRSLAALAADVDTLLDAIASADLDPQRCQFLTRQTVAMRTVIRRLRGEDLPLAEEAHLLFDVVPERVAEVEFDAALAEIDRLLPGSEPLLDRVAAWKKYFELPANRVMPAVDLVQAEVRRRTQALFELPPGEAVEVRLVRDKPWTGYNWYLGDYRSRVELNTDLPVLAYRLPDLLAHEGYPGHHTEHAIKEQRLYRDAGRIEHSILLLNAPECLISEGIATVALDVIFPEAELATWLAAEFYPACGLAGVDVDQVLRLNRALQALAGVCGNAAFLLHEDGRPEDEVVEYLQHYGLRTEAEARQSFRFISHALFRSYIFTYFYGERLLRRLFTQDDMCTAFGRLLAEPVMPSDLRRG
jgi:hypothetical protein